MTSGAIHGIDPIVVKDVVTFGIRNTTRVIESTLVEESLKDLFDLDPLGDCCDRVWSLEFHSSSSLQGLSKYRIHEVL